MLLFLAPLACGAYMKDKGFQYRKMEGHIMKALGYPKDLPVEQCQRACQDETTCVAWEVCAPLGDGCDGCYLAENVRLDYVDHPGWTSAIMQDRMDLVPEVKKPETIEECETFLLNANGGDHGSDFHALDNLKAYNDCGQKLRMHVRPKNVTILGQHWPTMLITHFRDPEVLIPENIELELTGTVQPREQAGGSTLIDELHKQAGTESLKNASAAHSFLLPFYDTNIGHWIKQYGSMNVMQSYEMQSILRTGDVVIDVGANLGSYTLPFGEKVGRTGAVLAFEPFRWLFQMLTANVALNGLSNVWTLPMALGDRQDTFLARPPQLRFFSSPGGMKVLQDQDVKIEDAVQLYDWEANPEEVTMATLDSVLQQQSGVRVPHIQDIRLIKIDVEGMEAEVVRGARLAIRQFSPIIWTENVAYFESNGTDISFLRLMDEMDYTCGKAQNSPNDLVCMRKSGGHQIKTEL